MFRSLRTRLWLTYAVLIGSVLCLISTSLVIYLMRNPAVVRQEILRLELAANLLQRTDRLLILENPNRYQQIVERADTNLNIRILILDASGNVLADSRAASAAPLPKITLPLTSSNRFTQIQQIRDDQNKTWFYTLRLLDDRNILFACLPRPRLTLRALLREEFLTPFVRTGLVALALSLLFAWWISRWVVQPLEKINAAARSVSSGKYQRLPLEGPGEVQALANSFNEMTHKVQVSQKSQRDFVANISHDLKTPLTSIQGFAQAILDGTANTPASLHQAGSIIHAEATRMHRMVQDLLELARLDSGIAEMQRQPVDMAILLQGVASRLAPQAQAGKVEIQTHIQTLPALIGDTDRLTQAISNLVDNAIKFSPSDGIVMLCARAIGSEVEVAVVDNGPGIPTGDLTHIFDRFYQTDKSRSANGDGIGLGLTISREIVQAHGGRIAAYNNASLPISWIPEESKINSQGSTFFVSLPVVQSGDITAISKKQNLTKGSE